MCEEHSVRAIRRERGLFVGLSLVLVIGVPLGMWFVAAEMVAEDPWVARYWNSVGYWLSLIIMHVSAVYLVWRLSRFLNEAWSLTALWCVLSLFVFPLYLIPAIVLLWKSWGLEKALVEARLQAVNAELDAFLLKDPSEPEIVAWMAEMGFQQQPSDVPCTSRDARLGREGREPAIFCHDFYSRELNRILRVGRGAEDRPSPGAPIGTKQYVAPDSALMAEMRHTQATEFEARGDFEAAIAAYRQAIAAFPEEAASHNALGLLLARLHRYHEAATEFRAACNAEPDWAEARANLGCALHDLGRWDEAVTELRAAIALAPSYAKAHLNLAIALGKMDRFGEARGAVLQALALEPANLKAQRYLRDLDAAMGGGRL